jgi:Tfp pilus assembly PilM family ATPase
MEHYLKGRIYWSSVSFALMPKYATSIKLSGFEVPVIDVSEHPVLKETAKWLKEQAKPHEKK